MIEECKQNRFISPTEKLPESLEYVQPKFYTLYEELLKLQGILQNLPSQVEKECKDAFVYIHQEEIIHPYAGLHDFSTFQELLNNSIAFMILTPCKRKYVQCLMAKHAAVAHEISQKTLNFAKQIAQCSLFRRLFSYVKHSVLYFILCNYTVVIKYKREYFQVAGKPLSHQFKKLQNQLKFKEKEKSKTVEKNSFQGSLKNSIKNTEKDKNTKDIHEKKNEQKNKSHHQNKDKNHHQNIDKDQHQNKDKDQHQNKDKDQILKKWKNQKQNKDKQNNKKLNKIKNQDNIQEQKKDNNFQDSKKRQKKDKKQEQKQQKKKIDPFEVDIHRTAIFYCAHTNRTLSFFHRNIFFDKGVEISNTKEELKIVTMKIYQKFLINLSHIHSNYLQKFYVHLEKLIGNFRRVFALHFIKNRKRCHFETLLVKYCKLPHNFQQLKKKTEQVIHTKQSSIEYLFDEIYQEALPYSQITKLLRTLLTQLVPIQLIGKENLESLKFMMKEFVEMKRYENLRMEDYLHRMNAFDIPWLQIKQNRQFTNQIIRRSNSVLAQVVGFIFNQILIPVIKYHFYVTQRHKEANKIFYFRKPLWILVQRLALYKFNQQNLTPLNIDQAEDKKQSTDHYPEGKLRILPKKGTFRPIITFNKKINVDKNSTLKLSLQRILSNTQLVLRHMKNNMWEGIGFSVFDNRQIKKRIDDFILRWRGEGCPKLAYFTLDIKKCYDSINTKRLLDIIKQTPFIEEFYFIKKYQRIYRNKRPLIGQHHISSFFNHKQRIAASPISKDPFLVNENDTIPSLTVYSSRQRSINKDQIIENLNVLCQGSIIHYKNYIWGQSYGIPQGLNVSGVVCSLYFGTLQNIFLRDKVVEGVLMRLTDDYLYIGYEDEARNVLDGLMKCAFDNQFEFSSSKMSKNFYHKDFPQMEDRQEIFWIGKKINLKTMQMQPVFEESSKIYYAMNVNLRRENIRSFMKNKFKSLLTNHFESYFKPKLFQMQICIKMIRLFVKVSLQKYSPFLQRYHLLNLQNPQHNLFSILNQTLHDYVVYVCKLMQTEEMHKYNLIKKTVWEELLKFLAKKEAKPEYKKMLKQLNQKYFMIKTDKKIAKQCNIQIVKQNIFYDDDNKDDNVNTNSSSNNNNEKKQQHFKQQ